MDIKRLYLTKLASNDSAYRIARLLSGSGGDYLRLKRMEKMRPIDAARDKLIRDELLRAGHKEIADDPKHFETFKIILKIPRTRQGATAAKILAEQTIGSAGDNVSAALIKRINHKLGRVGAEIGATVLNEYVSGETGDRVTARARLNNMSPAQIRKLADKYRQAMRRV